MGTLSGEFARMGTLSGEYARMNRESLAWKTVAALGNVSSARDAKARVDALTGAEGSGFAAQAREAADRAVQNASSAQAAEKAFAFREEVKQFVHSPGQD
jgi:hypothetical protein